MRYYCKTIEGAARKELSKMPKISYPGARKGENDWIELRLTINPSSLVCLAHGHQYDCFVVKVNP